MTSPNPQPTPTVFGGDTPSGPDSSTGGNPADGGGGPGTLIDQAGDAVSGAVSGAASDVKGAATVGLDGLADAIKDAAKPFTFIASLADGLYKVFMPSNLIRIVCGIAGFFCIIFAVVLLAREVKNNG